MVFVVPDVASKEEGLVAGAGGSLTGVTNGFLEDEGPGAEAKVMVSVAGPVFMPVRSVVMGMAGLWYFSRGRFSRQNVLKLCLSVTVVGVNQTTSFP